MGVPAEPCNCNAMRQAERHVARLYERAFAPFGLTIDQFATLGKLQRLGPASIAGLAELLVMDRAMLAYVLKGLSPRGLVDVTRTESDGRRRRVAITEAGAALYAAARERWEAVNEKIDAALGPSALQLRELLKTVEGLDLRLESPALPATGIAGLPAAVQVV